MKVLDYLERIGHSADVSVDLAGLTSLHRAHVLAVPFENLEVQLGRKMGTALPPIFDKIVGARRGGWCFEMNGVFGWALSELGFDVGRISGGVMRKFMGAAADGNHLALLVQLPEGPFIADVGFSHGPIAPFALREGAFTSNGFDYALTRLEGDFWRLSDSVPGFGLSYDVRVGPADEDLFAQQCADLQVSPQSPFVQNLVVQRHVEGGLTVLRGRVLKHLRGGEVREALVQSADELVAVLRREFDLDVPEAAGLWPQIVARHEAVMAG